MTAADYSLFGLTAVLVVAFALHLRRLMRRDDD